MLPLRWRPRELLGGRWPYVCFGSKADVKGPQVLIGILGLYFELRGDAIVCTGCELEVAALMRGGPASGALNQTRVNATLHESRIEPTRDLRDVRKHGRTHATHCKSHYSETEDHHRPRPGFR